MFKLNISLLSAILLSLGTGLFSCSPASNDTEESTATVDTVSAKTASFPELAKDLTIYEVNIRQYTPEGTFKAFEAHLPRLKKWA